MAEREASDGSSDAVSAGITFTERNSAFALRVIERPFSPDDDSSQEEELFPNSSSAEVSPPPDTLANPEPEKSLSGRNESNPEVQEEREMPVLLEDTSTTMLTDRRLSSNTPSKKTMEPQGFTAEIEPKNDTILEDARKIEISTSCRNLDRTTSLSNPPSLRPRCSSWPGSWPGLWPCLSQRTTNEVNLPCAEKESHEEAFGDKTEQLISGKPLGLHSGKYYSITMPINDHNCYFSHTAENLSPSSLAQNEPKNKEENGKCSIRLHSFFIFVAVIL